MSKKYLFILLFAIAVLAISLALAAAISFSSKNTGTGSPVLPAASGLKILSKAPLNLPIPAMGSKSMLRLAKLAEHRPIVINFFASWCPLCVSELGALAKTNAKYHKQVLFVGIDTNDQDPLLAKKYLERSKADYLIGVNFFSTKITNAWGLINGLPVTFFINKNGHIEKDILGAESFPVLERRVTELLASGK